MQDTGIPFPRYMPDFGDDSVVVFSNTTVGPPVTIPSWLLWLEVALLALVVLLTAVHALRRRNVSSVCLFVGAFIIAACQALEQLAVIFMQSEAALRIFAPLMPFVLWMRWLGPLFLAIHVLFRLMEGRQRRASDHAP